MCSFAPTESFRAAPYPANPCPSIPGLHPALFLPFHNRDVKPCCFPTDHRTSLVIKLQPAPYHPAQIYCGHLNYVIRRKQCFCPGQPQSRYAYHIGRDAIYSAATSRSTVTCTARASAMGSVVPAESFRKSYSRTGPAPNLAPQPWTKMYQSSYPLRPQCQTGQSAQTPFVFLWEYARPAR